MNNTNIYLNSLNKFFKELEKEYRNYQDNYKYKLTVFMEPLLFTHKFVKNISKQINKFLAFEFNLLEIMNPDENKISDILAELLNPKGKHGQNENFLKCFLQTLKNIFNYNYIRLDSEDLHKVIIEREHFTDKGRRIDILISLPNNIFIAIENKIGSNEQKNQLEDYKEYLQKLSDGKFVLIYLDALGRTAFSIKQTNKENLKKSGNFLETSYHEFLIPWLKKCLKICESDKIKWFLRDFITWIEKNFNRG